VQPVDDLEVTPGDRIRKFSTSAADFVAMRLRPAAHHRRHRRFRSRINSCAPAPMPKSTSRPAYTAMPVRSLTARQVYDAILLAAGQREAALEATASARRFSPQFRSAHARAAGISGGIPQILTLLNGPLVVRLTDPATAT